MSEGHERTKKKKILSVDKKNWLEKWKRDE